MKAFVINLESSTGRREFMRSQLDRLGLEYEFLKAVDGREFAQSDFEKHCDMKRLKEWPHLLTPGAVGCTLSHYQAYKEIVRQDLPYAVILEDDSKLSPSLPEIVARIGELYDNGALQQGELVLLYYRGKFPVEFSNREQLPVTRAVAAHYPVNIWAPMTTAAYVLTKSTAERLIKMVYPVGYTSDSWGVFHREGSIDSLRCIVPVAVESGFFRSDIGYESGKMFSKLVRFLESRDIFPVKQLLQKRRRYLDLKQTAYRLVDKKTDWQVRPDQEKKTAK